MKSSLKNMVVVLFSITAIAALLVALVNELTLDTIKATEAHNKDLAKLEVLPPFDGEARYEEIGHSINDGALTINVTKISNSTDGSLVGYAVEAPSITKNGYADRIYLMVGFVETEQGTLINGVKVLSQKETPGLGANMTKEGNALERSVVGNNPSAMTFKVKKDDASGSFDSLTGSTVSSRAYANAIETAYAAYLWAKGELPTSSDAQSGATKGSQTSDDDSVAVDAESGATLTDGSNYEQELEAQKGDISNE
ncbi:MAG: RnfABCDGE type electron transport complex subunit G [Alistipes sp.]|nr:RnfABCDGE type electron transport complex subunit G [Alistipes sp.]